MTRLCAAAPVLVLLAVPGVAPANPDPDVLALWVGADRYSTRIHAVERGIPPPCPSAGLTGGFLRLDRTTARRDLVLSVEVVNTGQTCLRGGWDFWYERLRTDGSWERVETQPYPTPAIGIVTPSGGSTRHDARVFPELQPGRHRLVKTLSVPEGRITLSAEFDVVA